MTEEEHQQIPPYKVNTTPCKINDSQRGIIRSPEELTTSQKISFESPNYV